MELVPMAACKTRDASCLGHLVGDLRLLSERVISITKEAFYDRVENILAVQSIGSHGLGRLILLDLKSSIFSNKSIFDRPKNDSSNNKNCHVSYISVFSLVLYLCTYTAEN
jgi:hypothetical protein